MDGTPLAVVWNFAIHGTAFGDSNLLFSADIMGAVSDRVETLLGVPALFANGARR
jgi:neutral ceramidase